MPRTSEVERFFVQVQGIISSFFEKGKRPTINTIQLATYGRKYNSDSRTQKQIVYGCITRGREYAIKQWNQYVESKEFVNDVTYIDHYEPVEIKNQIDSDDFRDFHSELQYGKFGEETEEIRENLGQFPAVAIVFDRRIQEYSKTGNNFIIPRVVKGSKVHWQWFIPSFWRWNIRECKLYGRSLKVLMNQLERGRNTRVLLPSGQPIQKALEVGTVLKASLEDKTVWTCPNCTARNLGTTTNCAICETAKP